MNPLARPDPSFLASYYAAASPVGPPSASIISLYPASASASVHFSGDDQKDDLDMDDDLESPHTADDHSRVHHHGAPAMVNPGSAACSSPKDPKDSNQADAYLGSLFTDQFELSAANQPSLYHQCVHVKQRPVDEAVEQAALDCLPEVGKYHQSILKTHLHLAATRSIAKEFAKKWRSELLFGVGSERTKKINDFKDFIKQINPTQVRRVVLGHIQNWENRVVKKIQTQLATLKREEWSEFSDTEAYHLCKISLKDRNLLNSDEEQTVYTQALQPAALLSLKIRKYTHLETDSMQTKAARDQEMAADALYQDFLRFKDERNQRISNIHKTALKALMVEDQNFWTLLPSVERQLIENARKGFLENRVDRLNGATDVLLQEYFRHSLARFSQLISIHSDFLHRALTITELFSEHLETQRTFVETFRIHLVSLTEMTSLKRVCNEAFREIQASHVERKSVTPVSKSAEKHECETKQYRNLQLLELSCSPGHIRELTQMQDAHTIPFPGLFSLESSDSSKLRVSALAVKLPRRSLNLQFREEMQAHFIRNVVDRTSLIADSMHFLSSLSLIEASTTECFPKFFNHMDEYSEQGPIKLNLTKVWLTIFSNKANALLTGQKPNIDNLDVELTGGYSEYFELVEKRIVKQVKRMKKDEEQKPHKGLNFETLFTLNALASIYLSINYTKSKATPFDKDTLARLEAPFSTHAPKLEKLESSAL